MPCRFRVSINSTRMAYTGYTRGYSLDPCVVLLMEKWEILDTRCNQMKMVAWDLYNKSSWRFNFRITCWCKALPCCHYFLYGWYKFWDPWSFDLRKMILNNIQKGRWCRGRGFPSFSNKRMLNWPLLSRYSPAILFLWLIPWQYN
jgi:hypothetical protein